MGGCSDLRVALRESTTGVCLHPEFTRMDRDTPHGSFETHNFRKLGHYSSTLSRSDTSNQSSILEEGKVGGLESCGFFFFFFSVTAIVPGN